MAAWGSIGFCGHWVLGVRDPGQPRGRSTPPAAPVATATPATAGTEAPLRKQAAMRAPSLTPPPVPPQGIFVLSLVVKPPAKPAKGSGVEVKKVR